MTATRPLYVVGIGGSAGGLRAFIALFDGLPGDTGMAFVIISHMSPTNPHSLLAELLQAHTRMPVATARAGMQVQADHVYVIPVNADLRLNETGFAVTAPRTMNKQVDIFFTSLATAMGPHAIGIIVSGYDGDGSLGCAQIKAKGGTTFAQDASASVDGMPLSAQAAGCIDRVLPAERMGAALQALADGARARSPSRPADR